MTIEDGFVLRLMPNHFVELADAISKGEEYSIHYPKRHPKDKVPEFRFELEWYERELPSNPHAERSLVTSTSACVQVDVDHIMGVSKGGEKRGKGFGLKYMEVSEENREIANLLTREIIPLLDEVVSCVVKSYEEWQSERSKGEKIVMEEQEKGEVLGEGEMLLVILGMSAAGPLQFHLMVVRESDSSDDESEEEKEESDPKIRQQMLEYIDGVVKTQFVDKPLPATAIPLLKDKPVYLKLIFCVA